MFFKKLFSYLINPKKCVNYIKYRRLHSDYGRNLSDEQYIKEIFKLELGRDLDLTEPKTFNEKMQWLKLYDRKPEYTIMVDKYLSKQYVADRIGDEYVVPLYGVWDKFDDIDFDTLPEQFVLKTTHDCGGVVICRDKSKFDKEVAGKKIKKSLANNYYWHVREWPYKDVVPRVIAEKYMQDGDSQCLPVYKFLCFGGRAAIVQTIQNDKMPNETIDYFDRDWNLLDLRQNYPNSKTPLKKPENFEEMLNIADRLAKERESFLRVDLYHINGKIYFSEFTFFSDAGMAKFNPSDWDYTFGSWIKLPEKKLD